MKIYSHIRGTRPCRAAVLLPYRLFLLIRHLCGGRNLPYYFRPLKPNYQHYWMPDSDAVASLDQFETALWFHRQGDQCLQPRTWLARFLQHRGAMVFRIVKQPIRARQEKRNQIHPDKRA